LIEKYEKRYAQTSFISTNSNEEEKESNFVSIDRKSQVNGQSSFKMSLMDSIKEEDIIFEEEEIEKNAGGFLD